MFVNTNNLAPGEYWKTKYPPELVGEYLKELQERTAKHFEMSRYSTGAHVPIPEGSLDGFLVWCVERGSEDE